MHCAEHNLRKEGTRAHSLRPALPHAPTTRPPTHSSTHPRNQARTHTPPPPHTKWRGSCGKLQSRLIAPDAMGLRSLRPHGQFTAKLGSLAGQLAPLLEQQQSYCFPLACTCVFLRWSNLICQKSAFGPLTKCWGCSGSSQGI